MIIRYRRIGPFLFWGGYQLVDDVQYKTSILGYDIFTDLVRLDPGGMLTIKKWYAWDGPTYGVKTDDFIAGSCIHDPLCDLVNKGLLPEYEQCKVDEEMMNVNTKQKMHWFRRFYTYFTVRGYQLNKKGPYQHKVYTIHLAS